MFTSEIAKTLVQHSLNNEFAVDFDLVWQWLGYSTKGNAKRKFENAGFVENLDFIEVIQNDKLRPQGGTSTEIKIFLTIDCVKQFCMMANTEQGKQVRLFFIEAEKELRQLQEQTPKVLPETYKEALIALVKEIEERELLEAQNQQLEEENELLSEAVDELFEYSSIIRIAKFNNVSETNFSWRRLKSVSQKLGEEIKKVPCPRFQWKNLYSHNAWRSAYPNYKLPETTTLVIKSDNS